MSTIARDSLVGLVLEVTYLLYVEWDVKLPTCTLKYSAEDLGHIVCTRNRNLVGIRM